MGDKTQGTESRECDKLYHCIEENGEMTPLCQLTYATKLKNQLKVNLKNINKHNIEIQLFRQKKKH